MELTKSFDLDYWIGVISGTGTYEINDDVSFYIDLVLLSKDAPSN
jgi:hypothetical protein